MVLIKLKVLNLLKAVVMGWKSDCFSIHIWRHASRWSDKSNESLKAMEGKFSFYSAIFCILETLR